MKKAFHAVEKLLLQAGFLEQEILPFQRYLLSIIIILEYLRFFRFHEVKDSFSFIVKEEHSILLIHALRFEMKNESESESNFKYGNSESFS